MSTNYELLTDVRVYLREKVRGIDPDNDLLESWDDFFTTYDAIIRRFAVASGIRPWEVEDCVKEVWAAVVDQLEGFELDPEGGPGRFRAWLYRIVRRTASKTIFERMQYLASTPEQDADNDQPQ